ncbi:MAG: zinc ribbon domain-containing protein [Candidatus Dormibacteria bacterium]|jgi:putative FmdB family regulatory protein
MFDSQAPGGLGYPVLVPLYEYRCNACTSVFEVLRPMAQRELAAVCPRCESRASMPLISRVAMVAGGGSAAGAADPGGGGCGGSCAGCHGCGAS